MNRENSFTLNNEPGGKMVWYPREMKLYFALARGVRAPYLLNLSEITVFYQFRHIVSRFNEFLIFFD
jgi:hypothetical protein